MGNTCKSMADSGQCMTKPLQYCEVISLQLIKINGKKKVWIHTEAKNRWCGGRVCGGRGMATGTGLFMKTVTSWVWYDQMGDKPQLLIPSHAAPLGIAKLSPARMLNRVRLFVTSWTVPAKLLCPRGFSRQDCWSRAAMPSFRESSWSSDRTRCLSHWQTGLFTTSATWEAPKLSSGRTLRGEWMHVERACTP